MVRETGAAGVWVVQSWWSVGWGWVLARERVCIAPGRGGGWGMVEGAGGVGGVGDGAFVMGRLPGKVAAGWGVVEAPEGLVLVEGLGLSAQGPVV